MRPLRLTLQAFGPFAGVETIDFRAAHDARLFGIYGPTGAGKTSILDGLCFALFGESSGEERGGEDLRSHHAPRDLVTEARLVFEVGARRYHLVRRPRQVTPALRGGGVTERPHYAALYEATDLDVHALSDENPGRVLAERRVEQVADELREILGYTARQFRQVVLLPQGRFRQLLTAGTEERSAVLRGLFDVGLYERLVDALKDQAQALRSAVEQGRAAMAARLSVHGLADLEELGVRRTELAAKVAELDGSRAKIRAARDQVRGRLEAARALAEAFAEYDAAQAAAEQAAEQEPQRAALDSRRVAAERARTCEAVDLQLSDAAGRLEKGEAAVLSAAEAAQQAAAAHVEALARVEASNAREAERAEAVGRVVMLRAYRARVETSLPRRQAANEAETARQRSAEARTAAASDFEAQGALVQKLAEGLETARTEAAARSAHEIQRGQLRAETAAVQAFEDATAEVDRLSRLFTPAEGRASEAARSLEQASKREREAEAELTRSRAGHLAASLQPGEPCPVCGSLDHPALAVLDGDEASVAERLRTARADRVAAELAERDALNKVAGLRGELEGAKRRLESLPPLARPKAELAAALAAVDTALAGETPDLAALEGGLVSARTEHAIAAQKLEVARANFETANRTAAAAAAALGSALSDIPEELHDPETLERAILDAEALTEELNRAHSALQSAEREADQANRQAAAEHARAKASCRELRDDRARHAGRFTEALRKAGLSEVEYAAARQDVSRLAEIAAELEEMRTATAAVTARLAQAQKRVRDQERPDIVVLEAQAAEADAQVTAAEREHTTAEQTLAALAQAQTELTVQAAAVGAQATDYQVVGHLAELTDGRNSQRMKLRDFAIAATFEAVLEAANLRFSRMSAGRYLLMRKQVIGDARTTSGLEVEVFDAHTDQRRDAHTLSGGEGFLASLSMALGLSDVVQAEAGGVKLDAIFIDEGFGHLDDESLDLALETLRDLVGHDRAVGVISHVDAVKQQIPNGFELERGVNGSRVLERCLT